MLGQRSYCIECVHTTLDVSWSYEAEVAEANEVGSEIVGNVFLDDLWASVSGELHAGSGDLFVRRHPESGREVNEWSEGGREWGRKVAGKEGMREGEGEGGREREREWNGKRERGREHTERGRGRGNWRERGREENYSHVQLSGWHWYLPLFHCIEIPHLHHFFLSVIDICKLIYHLDEGGWKEERGSLMLYTAVLDSYMAPLPIHNCTVVLCMSVAH